MAVARINTATPVSANVGTGTFNVSVTVGAGSNRALILAVGTNQGTDSVTGVTWNGQSLSLMQSLLGTGLSMWVSFWYLLEANLSTTTANAIVSISSATNGQAAFAYVLSGVNQSTPFSTPYTKQTVGTGNPLGAQPTMAGNVGDMYIDAYIDDNQAGNLTGAPSAGSGGGSATIVAGTPLILNGANSRVLMGSTKVVAATSDSMPWSLSSNPEGAWLGATVAQAVGGPPSYYLGNDNYF